MSGGEAAPLSARDVKALPRVKVGRVAIPAVQFGLWKLGGPPYFRQIAPGEVVRLIEILKLCAEHGISIDNAPAYGKGSCDRWLAIARDMLSRWLGEMGIAPSMEEALRAIRRRHRKWGPPARRTLIKSLTPRGEYLLVFTKCGLWWKTRAPTHADMNGSPEYALGRGPVNPREVRALIRREFEESRARTGFRTFAGYALHYPSVRHDKKGKAALSPTTDGVLPVLAELYNEKLVGSIGVCNIHHVDLLGAFDERLRKLGARVHYLQNRHSIMESFASARNRGALSRGELADYCRKRRIARVAYSALGHGPPITPGGRGGYVLDWDVRWYIGRERQARDHEFRSSWHPRFAEAAGEWGLSMPELALSLLIEDGIVPIFSSASPGHTAENIAAYGKYLASRKRLGPARSETLKGRLNDLIEEFHAASRILSSSAESRAGEESGNFWSG